MNKNKTNLSQTSLDRTVFDQKPVVVAVPPVDDEEYRQLLRTLESEGLQDEDEPDAVELGEEELRYDKFEPDELDLIFLAYAYLGEAAEQSFFSFRDEGLNDREAENARWRFERVASHLSPTKRQEVISGVELFQRHDKGDEWEVFKYQCDWGLWNRSVNMDKVRRVADSMPEEMTRNDEPFYGKAFLETLNDVRAAERARKSE